MTLDIASPEGQEIARDLALVACGALLIRHPRTALALDSRLV